MESFACEMQEMRNEKSETGNKDFECSHPISHFSHDILTTKSLIWPREMGNGIQTRILMTEVWPSGIEILKSYSDPSIRRNRFGFDRISEQK